MNNGFSLAFLRLGHNRGKFESNMFAFCDGNHGRDLTLLTIIQAAKQPSEDMAF
jgi:hypothetical protein